MAQCDIDVGYEYFSSIVDQPDGGATGELWDLGTAKAVKALMGARERVSDDVPHFVRSLACIEQPEVLEALQELLNSVSAEMKKEATEWLAR